MIHVDATLQSLSAYSQSGFFRSQKKDGENADAFERRCWREKMHTANGSVIIPPMALKKAIDSAASFINRRIPGEGQRTWKKVIETGTFISDPVVLGIKPDEVDGEWIQANADGKKDSGSRVPRCFPVMHQWSGDLRIHIINPKITEAILREIVEAAGMYIGIGRFRPEKGGYYGRFRVTDWKWLADESQKMTTS